MRPACTATSVKRENGGSGPGRPTLLTREGQTGSRYSQAEYVEIVGGRETVPWGLVDSCYGVGAADAPEANILSICCAGSSVGSIRIAFCADSRASVYLASLANVAARLVQPWTERGFEARASRNCCSASRSLPCWPSRVPRLIDASAKCGVMRRARLKCSSATANSPLFAVRTPS